MRDVLAWVLRLVTGLVFPLRYRVRVEGLDEVGPVRNALILPNHPAYVDPPLVLQSLWARTRPTPLLLAAMFRNPLLAWLPWVMGALTLPKIDHHSAADRQRTEQAIDAVVAGLRRGRNHIVWPAGRARRDDRESLGAVRSPFEILRRAPDANVLLVRTWGLWGSMFSYARTGRQPDLLRCLAKGIGILVANLVFFAPRRQVTITVERIASGRFANLSRDEVNRLLEQWYNKPGPEPPTHVPYHALLARKTFVFPRLATPSKSNTSGKVAVQTRAAVAQLLAEWLGRELDTSELSPDTTLESLGLDSLERVDLSRAVEQRFGFTGDQLVLTVGDVEALADGLADRTPPPPPPPKWFDVPNICEACRLDGQTIQEALVHRALSHPGDVVAVDEMSGLVTHGRFLAAALALSEPLRRLPAPRVGLMLPASVATDVAFCALLLAGKLPVLLNWTTGPSQLDHAAQVTGLKQIVTSRRFLDRVEVTVAGTDYLAIEDLRAQVGRLGMMRRFLQTRFAPASVRRNVPAARPDDPAVILFTSGSETAPKAVPLSHRNILSNIRGVLDAYELSRHDSVLGFLPPFHSFGLTVTSLMPILAGSRVVHHSDPTDAVRLARKIGAYKATIVCGTPTFLSLILQRATPEDLGSLRLVVVGAEKCPLQLYDRLAQMAPEASLIEGYGITECAPLISGNRPGHVKRGSVGIPLPEVEVCVVDPESLDPLAEGQTGMLLVCGPNVFGGYLSYDGATPFHEHEGRRWYVTGDLARLDEEGFIHIEGRLRRFLKVGGEMISLPALEQPLAQHYPPIEAGPRVAVEGVETELGRCVVLFTTESITLREANSLLQDGGFHGVMRLDEVRRIEQIPLLGTGKTDYQTLRAQIGAGAASGAP